MAKNIKVMLTTEGTYPHHSGGVSTWCDALIKNLDKVDYTVYSIVMNPFVAQTFELPSDTKLISVPLWGTEEPFEHLKTPFSQVYRSKSNTTDNVVKEEFIPIFKELIEEIVSDDKKPIRLGNLLLELYKYFRKYDYKDTFKSENTWNVFSDIIISRANDKRNMLGQPSVFSMIQSLGWLYRFLSILYTPVPKVDVTHSAAAAFCGIPCVLAKLLYNTPYLLTEHGVYIREQYLSLSKRGYDSYLNTFFIRMVKSVVKLNYAFADQISPVCSYNTRWETKFGVLPGKIKVLYNGVSKDYFYPREIEKQDKNLRVVAVARVDPVKDLISMIKAAKMITEKMQNVTFHVYGSVTVPEYYEECLEFVKQSGLEGVFVFEGNTNDTPTAYASADVIALSSITEAFPYSVVEAMMMGKPVVATDVGGISEALGDIGFLVTPGKPEELAKAVLELLENKSLREYFGVKGRERALELFDIDSAVANYYNSYVELRDAAQPVNLEVEKLNRQKLLAERGYALLDIGQWQQGIAQLRAAIKEYSDSLAVPVLIAKISEAYDSMGDSMSAENERMKANLLADMAMGTRIA